MSICRTTTKDRKWSRRGSIALTAIVALIVVLIIAVGMLTVTNGIRSMGKHQLHLRGAHIMADSGIDYGYWETVYQSGGTSASYTASPGNGSFNVTVNDNAYNIPGTIKLVSIGHQDGDIWQTTRVMAGYAPTVFDYAICSNSALSASTEIYTGTAYWLTNYLNPNGNGPIRANGNIQLTSSSTGINGSAISSGSISITNIAGTTTPNSAPIIFPVFNVSSYQSIAATTYSSSQSFYGYTFLLPDTVVYVNGNVTLNSGMYVGTGMIVASGSITIAGNTSYFPGAETVFLAGSGIAVKNATISAVGFYFTHNSAGTDTFQENGSANLTVTSGGIAADVFSLGHDTLTVTHDPNINITLGHQMGLPGD
jgi:hypothetical protein